MTNAMRHTAHQIAAQAVDAAFVHQAFIGNFIQDCAKKQEQYNERNWDKVDLSFAATIM